MSLKSVHTILEDIAAHSGRLEKEAIINNRRNDEIFTKVIYYMLNPYMTFNMTSIPFAPDALFSEYKNNQSIFDMLDYLSAKNGATDQEKQFLTSISSVDKFTADVVDRIVSKDPRCGANIKIFKKFIPSIPYHCPMLCDKDISAYMKIINDNFSTSCYSIKKDGVRTWAVYNIESKMISYLSRSGKEFPNFNFAFDDDIHKASKSILETHPEINNSQYIIYDGEVDAGQTKSFQKLMTQVRKLDGVNPQIFRFHIFDLVIDGFSFIKRYQILHDVLKTSSFSKTFLLEHFQVPEWVKTEKDLIQLSQIHIDQGEEGIVVKTHTGVYEYKRSRQWLKVKKFETLDAKVTGWQYGTGKNANVMGKLNCILDSGIRFNVGSGFSDQERIDFMTNTPIIIEVDYQDMTKDGKPRFGTFVRIRDDKDEIN